MGRDLVRPDPERHGALRMMEAARPILRGDEGIELRRDTIRAERTRPVVRTMVSDEDAPLLSALKAKRRALAEAAGVPAYIIFTDRTLIEMAETRPQTLDALARIGGVGATKLDRYGKAFLEVITGSSVEQPHPARRRLAGRESSDLYDRLAEAQARLSRGADGLEKPLSCSASLLAKLAELRPDDMGTLTRLLGERRAERFGAAFLDVLAES